VVAVRFTAEELSRVRFEMQFAARRGVSVSPSELIRKAVGLYGLRLSQDTLERDYPPMKKRRKPT
jgi:hypothetical protein